MLTGFSQPFDFIDPDGNLISPTDRLLADDDPFLANNALEVQVQTITLTGGEQDITSYFDFAPPGGDLSFDGDDMLSYAFTAIAVDDEGNTFGEAATPIYLRPVALAGDTQSPDIDIEVIDAENAITPVELVVTFTDDLALDPLSVSLEAFDFSYGDETVEVLWSDVTLDDDGLSGQVKLYLLPESGAWDEDTSLTVTLQEGAARDLANNDSALTQVTYDFVAPEGPEVDSLSGMTQLTLQNVDLVNPTSIDVGPDGRLYVSQQNGLIVALTVEKVITPMQAGWMS